MQFIISKEFKTSPEVLYKAWLTSNTYAEMTGAAAEVSDRVGGEFSAWDGYITGKDLELIPNKIIKQSWRTTEFADGQKDSLVEITFTEVKPGLTKLTLKHSELPEGDTQYKQGWEEFYFKPMAAYFK